MTLSSLLHRICAGLSGAVLLTACSDRASVVLGPRPIDPLFASYVALGNSITAGYQSGGITDTTQQESYAKLLADQMHTRYAYPALQTPGCPPPIIDFQTQARLGDGSTSQTCALRTTSSITTVLNNVAVPGATTLDPTSPSTSASNALTTFILGGKTQVERARDANPTFVSVWIGNNDVLPAAVSGILVPTANVSPGVTPLAAFQTNYDAMINQLKTISTLKGAVLIGVVQVSAAPVFFPAAALFNTDFKNGFDQFAGTPTTLLPTCTPATTSLIAFTLAGSIRSGQHPPVIGCEKNSIPGTQVGDIFILDAAEQASLQSTVSAYNTYIQSVADANGWAYFDPNPSLVALKAANCISTVPNLGDRFHPFGLCISLDGIHPSAQAHKVVANALINVINQKYSTSLEQIQ